MAKARIEDISFTRVLYRSQAYEYSASHQGLAIATTKGILDKVPSRSIELVRFQTDPEYRKIGIGLVMLNDLVKWSREKNATFIHGLLASTIFLDDNFDHVANYLSKYGFKIDGRTFRMDL